MTTVDKYQGQQNDYIILSLVRTKAVGHLRDVRRLIVAMSRARLGLYVFARVSLFRNCFELTPAFQQFLQRPTKLQLILNEVYPSERLQSERPSIEPMIVENMQQMANFVYSYYLQRVKAMKTYYEQQKKFQEPGSYDVTTRAGFTAMHPGEDRDTDSDEDSNVTETGTLKIPVPIQDEPLEEDRTAQVVGDSTNVDTVQNEPIEVDETSTNEQGNQSEPKEDDTTPREEITDVQPSTSAEITVEVAVEESPASPEASSASASQEIAMEASVPSGSGQVFEPVIERPAGRVVEVMEVEDASSGERSIDETEEQNEE